MTYLLDTHIVLWLVYEPHKLTHEVNELLYDKKQVIYFSSVNVWEVAIKTKLSKADFRGVQTNELYQSLLENKYLELPVLSQHCLTLDKLPLIHSDPFDRLLISQAISENFTLITHDKDILKYDNLKTLRA